MDDAKDSAGNDIGDDSRVRHADVTSEGLIVIFDDGREGLLKGNDVRHCVESTNGFAKLEELQIESGED